MKIGSGCGKNVTGWKQRRGRRFIRPELPDDALVENVRFTVQTNEHASTNPPASNSVFSNLQR